MVLFNNIYKNKKVLITGNTGFKGSWLTAWLLNLGADVYGISNGIPTMPSHFEVAELKKYIHYYEVDICHFEKVRAVVLDIEPDFVFHLAAQPLVHLSYESPLETLSTNIMGTAHILESLRGFQHPCKAIIITSDKCYDNVEWDWGYRETDALGGKDPYSASKGGTELVTKTYFYSFFKDTQSPIQVAVGRAGNAIGGGDWGKDRIVPDCVVAWLEGKTVGIRNPLSIRPWQHVLESLSGYLRLGQKLAENPNLNGEPFNFGPSPHQNFTVAQLINEMQKHWPESHWKDVSNQEKVYEANFLKLCCDKAFLQLEWRPTLHFDETVQLTMEWYQNYYQQTEKDNLNFTQKQIATYTHLAAQQGLAWTQ